MRSTQRGASGLFVAIMLLLVAVAAFAVFSLSRSTGQVERATQASGRFKNIDDAFVQYVAVNGRLPCPANPALDTGDPVPAAASAACTFPAGTLPWKALGLGKDDGVDPWGGKISYRVYTGAAGSLTQTDGASMVDCDITEPVPPKGTAAGGLCRVTKDTTQAEFLAGKGLQVNYFGTVSTDAAYLLVSHGPSGLGHFTTAGMQAPLPASADELSNLSAGGPFIAKAASAQGIGPAEAGHFDDVVAFGKLDELVRRAGRGAREWDDPIVSSTTFDMPTLTAALGRTPGYGDTGERNINFGGVNVSGFDSGGIQTLSFESVGGIEGIGTAGGNSSISSNGVEGVRLAFGQKARKLGITFNAFGVSGQFAERAELRFFDGATLLDTRIAVACRSASPDPPASFTLDLLTADFDNVEIRALVTTPNGGGSVQESEFLLSAVATCVAASTTCESPLHDAANACP